MNYEPASAEIVMAGLRCAAVLDLPLSIGGCEVRVPASLVPEIPEIEAGDDDWPLRRADELDASRRIGYCIASACREIERIGLDIGVIVAPTPLPAEERPDWLVRAPKAEEIEVPEPHVIEVRQDTYWIGWADLTCEVRGSGAMWIAVGLPSSLLGVHPNREAAIAWATDSVRGRWHAGISKAPPAPASFANPGTPQESHT